MTIEITRERVVQALCAHYAQDRLTTEELESRLARAQRASSELQLASLVTDLPALPDLAVPGVVGAPPVRESFVPPASPPMRQPETQLASWREAHSDLRVRHDPARQESQHYTSIMSGVTRKGPWLPAHRIDLFVMMGGVHLDFREAILAPGITEVNVLALMGGVEIIVPPGVRVEQEGSGFMGAFDEQDYANVRPEPDAPVIHITGFAMMAGVDIQVRYAGESTRDAKRRLKNQKAPRH